MRWIRARAAVVLAALLLPLAAPAAEPEMALGLDLSDELPEPAKIVAVPPRLANGPLDAPAYTALHAALAERLGARLVAREATLAALKRLPAAVQKGPELVGALARAVGAGKAVALRLVEERLQVAIYADPAAAPASTMTAPWTGRASQAAEIARLVVERAWEPLDLDAPEEAAAMPLALAAPPAENAPLEDPDLALEAPLPPKGLPAPVETRPPFLFLAVGAGPGYRDFAASGTNEVLPRAKGVMTALVLGLELKPSSFSAPLAASRWADFSLEADVRRTFAGDPRVSGSAAPPGGCVVDDDAFAARLGWRYALGGWAPRLGVGVGWAQARVHFGCAAPVASTASRGVELQGRVSQPIAARVELELRAGPWLRVGGDADGARAWAGELWLSGYPSPRAPVFLRAGVRTNYARSSGSGGGPTRERYSVGMVQLGIAI